MAADVVQTGLVGGFLQTEFPGLSAFYANRLKERKILRPTEIQRRVIPRLLAAESFIFRSATGTGKTFAYLLPLLEQLGSHLCPDTRGKPLLLIAAPTFELCSQIKGELDFLLKDSPLHLHVALVTGSGAPGRQADFLKKNRPAIIVGNPGRLLALARQGKLGLRDIRFLVLDEGDRLVADEHFEETAAMLSLLKPPFLVTACSATFSEKSRQRLLSLLDISPDVEDDSISDILREKVEHWAFFSPQREKAGLLRSLIAALNTAAGKKGRPVKALIFSSRADQVESIAARLKYHRLPAAFLCGGMDSTERRDALAAFRSGGIRFLVYSDLAARGLDIDGITHVIALDVCEDRNIYIHRAGRTARAGETGIMVSMGTEGEMRRLAAIEKNLGLIVYPKVLFGGKILGADT